jgi:hypothetical protein
MIRLKPLAVGLGIAIALPLKYGEGPFGFALQGPEQ